MANALLIVYDFPPLTSSGVFRPLRLLKQLKSHDWQATVIAGKPGWGALTDDSLLEKVPSEIRIIRQRERNFRLVPLLLHRVGLKNISQKYLDWKRLPDIQRHWADRAYRTAHQLVVNADPAFDLIWSTSAPYSSHLVGWKLKQQTGLPWVADFRDEWTHHPDLMAMLPTQKHREFHHEWEEKVLEGADLITTVSRGFSDQLKARYPSQADKVRVMTNGFDEDDFPLFQSSPDAPKSMDSSQVGRSQTMHKFRIVYTGMVYGLEPLKAFERALAQWVQESGSDPNSIAIEFVGHGCESIPFVAPDGVEVLKLGQEDHRESIRRLLQADLLLLFVDQHRGAGVIPGKLFSYLASGVPILAIADETSDVREIIAETSSGNAVAIEDVKAIVAALESHYQSWKQGTHHSVNPALIARYGSKAQASQWVRWFEQLLEKPKLS